MRATPATSTCPSGRPTAGGARVRRPRRRPRRGLSALGKAYVAGQLAHLEELTLLFAPNINSYKRYVEGSFAPTAVKWGRDNRTCAFRLVGHGQSLRLECRVPGGDVNPYLAVAGLIAAGLDGIDRGLQLEDAYVGNAYTAGERRVPDSLVGALDPLGGQRLGPRGLRRGGPRALREHGAGRAGGVRPAVTDWERFRGFERL